MELKVYRREIDTSFQRFFVEYRGFAQVGPSRLLTNQQKADMLQLKKPFTIIGWLPAVLLAGCGAVLVNQGAKEEPLTDGLKNPAALQAKVNVPADQKIVGNFEDGSTNINSKLYGAGGGTWSVFAGNGNTVNNPFVVSGGAHGTSMAVHLFGTLMNKGDNSYPSFTLQGKLKQSGYYDARAFSGVRFYYKSPSDDKAPAQRFKFTIAATLPTSNGGTCTDGCYNHFGADLSMSADWVQKSYSFNDLKRGSGWGSPITPPDLVDHLTEVVGLEWSHDSGNTAGSYPIDFWVDEVEFF